MEDVEDEEDDAADPCVAGVRSVFQRRARQVALLTCLRSRASTTSAALRRRSALVWVPALLLGLSVLLVSLTLLRSSSSWRARGALAWRQFLQRPFELVHFSSHAPVQQRTLVIYAYYENVAHGYQDNLALLLSTIQPDDGVQYVFVINGASDVSFPAYANVHTLYKANDCYDFGGYAAGLAFVGQALESFRFVILMNGSVRGPFLPLYLAGSLHWTQAFTQRIDHATKLVGTTINCQCAKKPQAPDACNPHVQSMVLATDQIGLRAMQDAGYVFTCYADIVDVVYYSELGASRAVLQAGYNIASLLAKYDNLDWRLANASGLVACNGRANPTYQNHYDGVPLHPLEVVFVKAKAGLSTLFATVAAYTRYASAHCGRLGGAGDLSQTDADSPTEDLAQSGWAARSCVPTTWLSLSPAATVSLVDAHALVAHAAQLEWHLAVRVCDLALDGEAYRASWPAELGDAPPAGDEASHLLAVGFSRGAPFLWRGQATSPACQALLACPRAFARLALSRPALAAGPADVTARRALRAPSEWWPSGTRMQVPRLPPAVTVAASSNIMSNISRGLVVYAWLGGKAHAAEAARSLALFVRVGLAQPAPRVIVVASASLPERAHVELAACGALFVSARGQCAETQAWCMYGVGVRAAVASQSAPATDFIFFTHSHARGPFLPSYVARSDHHWLDSFAPPTGVSAVAASVECIVTEVVAGGAGANAGADDGDLGDVALTVLSEHAFSLTMDAVNSLCHAGDCFGRGTSERTLSRELLLGGRTMISQLQKYRRARSGAPSIADLRGVHSAATASLHGLCNGGVSPLSAHGSDGVELHPFELVFVPHVPAGGASRQADAWVARLTAYGLGEDDPRDNAAMPRHNPVWLADALAIEQGLAQACNAVFDESFYRTRYNYVIAPDGYLPLGDVPGDALTHWRTFGFAAGKHYRWKDADTALCGDDFTRARQFNGVVVLADTSQF